MTEISENVEMTYNIFMLLLGEKKTENTEKKLEYDLCETVLTQGLLVSPITASNTLNTNYILKLKD